MHSFPDLADRCTTFTLAALNEANKRTIEALQTSGATALVKALQMIQLQKAIFAIGMFSIFDAILQEGLECNAGLDKATKILANAGDHNLKESFEQLHLAVNVLKHGRGRSYEKLIGMGSTLPFRVMAPDEAYFEEGDVSEVSSLVLVDDAFVQRCGSVIAEVALVIRRETGAIL